MVRPIDATVPSFRAVAHWGLKLCVCFCMGCTGCTQRAIVPPTSSIARPPVAQPSVARPSVGPSSPEQPPLSIPAAPLNDQTSIDPPGTDSLEGEPPSIDALSEWNISTDFPWPPAAAVREWKFVVVHHTASDKGNVDAIHAAHLQNKDSKGRPWLGIGYHFVIGNGKGMADGAIEPTFRWRDQTPGAHAGVAKYNERGVGVCLIGNFEETKPTSRQLASFKRLVRALQTEFGIPSEAIVGHGEFKPTDCPGAKFPLKLLRDELAAWNPPRRPLRSPSFVASQGDELRTAKEVDLP